jgi:hypothetical protein
MVEVIEVGMKEDTKVVGVGVTHAASSVINVMKWNTSPDSSYI